MINPLHVGLILIISKVFTILCLLRLCRNREYPGKFQNKTLISKPFFQMIAQEKREGKSFWSRGEAQIYPLHMGIMLTITKVFFILFLLACGNWEHPGNFQNKSVNSPFRWVPRYILFLPKLKEKERPFLEGCKKGDQIAILYAITLGWYKRWNSFSFCEILK